MKLPFDFNDTKLLKGDFKIDDIPPQGRFGTIRKHDVHTGIDLYCNDGDEVYSIKDGTVVNICYFTGSLAGSEWWNNTKAILIDSGEEVLLYGEIETILNIGDKIRVGQKIGNIKQVLKTDKGLPMSMLHLEMYETGYKGNGEIWGLNSEKPEKLLNIENFFLYVNK